MRRSTLRSALVVLVACLFALIAGSAIAQSTFAALTGTVLDSSGGVLPGVTVTVTNTRTQSTRTVVTDEVGNYQVPNLDAGEYRIVTVLSGFAEQTRQVELLALRAHEPECRPIFDLAECS